MATAVETPVFLSIVVPVYRSSEILPQLVDRVEAEMVRSGIGSSFELVLVNDASPDESWDVIRTLARERPFVRGVCLRVNAGQHNATLAGLHHARGEVVVVMDDDLQHPPESISAMVRALRDGYDVCYARYVNRKHPLWKRLGSSLNDAVANVLLNKPRDLYLSSFKALRREVVAEISRYDGPYVYLDGLILDATRSVTSIAIEHQSRRIGRGNYNLRKSISLWLKMATSFSVVPLRLATYAGVLIFVASMAMILFVIFQKLKHPELPSGWASLIAAVLFVGGVQTLFLGIIGEYLGRAYLKLNRKPQYVVRERTWTTGDPSERARV